jgi:hypothetical protein
VALSLWWNRRTALQRSRFRPLLEILEHRALPSATYSTTVLASSPTAYWRLGETSGTTAVSQVGAPGNNGTYVGAGIQLGQPGAIVDDPNTAVGFTGAANSGVTLPPPVFNFGGFSQESFEVWFRVNPGNGGVILGQVGNAGIAPGAAGGFAGYVPAIYMDTTGVIRAEMFWHGAVAPIGSAPGFNDGSWHHLVDVFNSGTETLFLDGTQQGTAGPGLSQVPYAGGSANYSYYLGTGFTSGWPGGNGGWFYLNGTLDEAAVYQNTALTLAQVQNHFNIGRANDASFQMGAYTAREDAGTAQIAITRSGNLTVTDSVLFSTVAGGTAVAGVDYTPVTNQVVNFVVGQATAIATVPILNRSGIQPNRTVNLTLTRNGATAAVVFPTAAAVLTITDVDTSTTLTSSANPSLIGQPVTFTATLTPTGMGGPTGTVTFFDNGTPLGTVALNAAQQAAFTTQTLTAGAHTITATYNGDASFATSTGMLTQTVTAAPLPPSSGGLFATGTDFGGLPEVKVFDAASGALKQDFLAYDPAFRGGVRVAVGDVNKDGILDLVTAPGPGGGTLVEVFSAKDLSLIMAFNAYDPSFRGGLFVAVADVNHDGFADIITAPDQGGGPLIKVFSGKDGSLLMSFNAYDSAFHGGVRVAAGDTNGDGFADIITCPGNGGGPLVRIFDGRTGVNLLSYNAYAGSFVGGIFVGAGDVDGDGKADVITSPGVGGGPLINVFSGPTGTLIRSFNAYPPVTSPLSIFGSDSVWQSGLHVAALDVNGDGKADIITGVGPSQRPEVKVFDGATLAVLDDFFAYDPTYLGGVFVGAGAP